MARDNFDYLLDVPDVPANFAYLLDPLEGSAFGEYLPVDDFFDEYLSKLDFSDGGSPSAGMSKGAREEPPPRKSRSTDRSESTYQQGLSDESPLSRSRSKSLANSSGGSGALSNGTALQPNARTAQQQQQQWQQQPQMSIQLGPKSSQQPNTISSGVVTSGLQANAAAPPAPQSTFQGSGGYQGGNAIVSGIPDQSSDRQAAKEPGKRKRVRDERQQLLNKLAQIRYREKKRSKTQTLEDQITALEEQLAHMRVKQTEATDLAQRNREIEEKLAALNGPQGGADAMVRLQASSRASAASPVPRDSQKDLDLLEKQWLAKSKEIKDLVALIGLGSSNKSSFGRARNDLRRTIRKNVSAKTRDLLAHVELRMAAMVSDVTSLCMRVMRLQGAEVEQLMMANYDMVCSLKGWKDESKWLRASKAINFTDEQRNKALLFRQQALQCLHGLYEDRRRLNDRILGNVEPQLFGPAASTTQATTTAAVDMLQVLEALAANLEAEQRELARQDWVLFRELLSPVQAGILVSESFPDHCDAMALLNATAQLAA